MKVPPSFRTIFLFGAAGSFLIASLAIEANDPAAAGSPAEKQTPALLLANVWNPSIDPTGWWMSEKYDGLRAFWDGQKLWSRNGNLIHAPDYFLAELPRNIVLDGELWIGHGKFEETMSIVRSETPDDRWDRVRFMVFDVPHVKGTFEERMQFLRANVSEANRFVRVVAQERC
jgi:DNA ligase-1